VDTSRAEQTASRWTATLSNVPSIFGRLMILSSLRDRNTGWYVHHGLELEMGEDTHGFLLKRHQEVFLDWQAMTVHRQMRDLKTHLKSVAQSAEGFGPQQNKNARIAHVLNTWVFTRPYGELVPLSASPLARDTFVSNIAVLVALLRNQVSEGKKANGMGRSGSV
jgi:hypothetical protein